MFWSLRSQSRWLMPLRISFAMHSKMPRDGNSGSSICVMAMFQSPLRARICSGSSLRGISSKNLEIFTLLSDGSGSLIKVQKKQRRLVHVGWAKWLVFLAVVLCGQRDSIAKSKKVGVFEVGIYGLWMDSGQERRSITLLDFRWSSCI